MSGKPRITVAGAGALGLTTALALADAGCAVSVFDPAPPGDNASGVAAGMLAPVFESVLDAETAPNLDLLLAARDLWPALEARIGILIDRAGAVALGDAAFLARVDQGMRGLGLHPIGLPRRTLEALAPGLAAPWTEGVLTREDWRIEPLPVLDALRRAAEAAGVVFHSRAATGFEGAERLVVASGSARDLAVIAPGLSTLTPIKGQILRLRTANAPGLVLRSASAYLAPTAEGVAVGATMEAGLADRAIDPSVVAALRRAAEALIPDLADAPAAAVAGVRAATRDGLPLVGRGRHPGVLLAAGARRNGWLLAPLVARLITACVTEGEAGPYAARLDPARFDGADVGGAA
jgi:glycine oxidase